MDRQKCLGLRPTGTMFSYSFMHHSVDQLATLTGQTDQHIQLRFAVVWNANLFALRTVRLNSQILFWRPPDPQVTVDAACLCGHEYKERE